MLTDLLFCLSEKEEYNSLFSGGKDCYTSFSQTFWLKQFEPRNLVIKIGYFIFMSNISTLLHWISHFTIISLLLKMPQKINKIINQKNSYVFLLL